MIDLSLAPPVAAFVRPAVLVVEGVTIVERQSALDLSLAEAERQLRTLPDPAYVVAAVRAMYRRFGVDPTKTRPSSEALVRRVRKGEPLPRINTMVDVGNWCSAETRLPFGLYDLQHVQGAVQVRLGHLGEQYAGIRKDVVHVAGRLAVADAEGPFGNPTSDSARTMVTPTTQTVLVVIFVPADLPAAIAEGALRVTAERTLRYAGGRVQRSDVLGP